MGAGRSVAVGSAEGDALATALVGVGVSPNEPIVLVGPGTGPHATHTSSNAAVRTLILLG